MPEWEYSGLVAGPRKRWAFPLPLNYDGGVIASPIRHYGRRHDQLNHAALCEKPEKASGREPIGQDVIVFMAAPRGMKPGTYPLPTRLATASAPIAEAAGTGVVLRILVSGHMRLLAVAMKDGEKPTEEVLLPERVEVEVYSDEDGEYVGEIRSARVLDAELFPTD